MKNKNNGLSPVQRDQLYSERTFIHHCIYDEHQNHKLDNIDKSFLRAAEADGFLKPLLQLKEIVTQEDSSQKETLVNYYSPHQIYIIVSLSKNIIIDSLLYNNRDIDFQKKQKTRYVNWGWNGFAFNIDIAKNGGKHHPNELDIFDYCKDFHNFLRLLHSFENYEYEKFDRNKERHFTDLPSIKFDFSTLEKDGKEVLRKFNLNIDKLRILRKNIGSLALQIDPLESWFYYIRKHPRWKKDLFKGDAFLAQEIYIIHDLIVEILEKVTGKEEPDLLESIHEKFYPMLLPRDEYATGTDIKALWHTIDNFKKWAGKESNKKLVPEGMFQRLSEFEKELQAFEDKYGDKSYVSGISRPADYEERLGIKDLDPAVLNYVNQLTKQRSEVNEDELKREIGSAISWRLHDLERKLWQILNEVGEVIRKEVDEAWREHQNPYGRIMSEDERNKLYENAQAWSVRRDEFDKTVGQINLIFCENCRKKPVKLKYDRGDQLFYDSFICEDCLKNMDEPRLSNLATWNCMYCGKVLYKFNYENRINDLLINKATSDIVLEYGRLKLIVRCGDRECGKENVRWIDWGWVS